MNIDVDIAIQHPRPTARQSRENHGASMREVLLAWQQGAEGRSFELGPSIGNCRSARLAFARDDDHALALRQLDASLMDASLLRTMTDHHRDRTRATTAITTRLQWRDWITSDLLPRRGSR
jgi:hypothetical protein